MAQIEGTLSREKLRDLRSLDSAKIRKRKGLCVVEGERSLAEAERTGSLLYLVASRDSDPDSMDQAGEQVVSKVPCYTLEHRRFREISDVKSGTGLLGVAQIPPETALGELEAVAGRCFLFYFDELREPGNVGALIRTAWVLGAYGVLLGGGTADPFNHKSVRASAGGVFHVPLFRGSGEREVAELTSWGYTVFTAQKGGQDYRSTIWPERSILALGNEAAGPSKWLAESGTAVGIPLIEGADSLNVVVAGGIIASRMVS